MSEFSDEAIQAYVDQLLPKTQQSGESPRDPECAVTRAVLIWMQDHPTPTPWLTYEVDGHKFCVRRNNERRVVTGKEM